MGFTVVGKLQKGKVRDEPGFSVPGRHDGAVVR